MSPPGAAGAAAAAGAAPVGGAAPLSEACKGVNFNTILNVILLFRVVNGLMVLRQKLMNGAGKNFVFLQKLNIKQKLPKKDV